jgi:protein gp37
MAERSGIEWTEATWNPVTGCDRISPGCENCYALTLAARLKAMGAAKYQNDGHPATSGPGFAVTCHPEALATPRRWREGRMVFVNSMSDLFHAKVPVSFIRDVFDVIADTPRHTYQILTKRSLRMLRLSEQIEIPPNAWIGVSIENADQAYRAAHLRRIEQDVTRWISAEPLLGPLDAVNLDGIDWVVAGGESGPGARPMHPDWARDLRDRCAQQGCAYFFKQWGAWEPTGWRGIGHDRIERHSLNGEAPRLIAQVGEPIDEFGHRVLMRRVGKHAAGRELDGRTWDQYPAARATPSAPAPGVPAGS